MASPDSTRDFESVATSQLHMKANFFASREAWTLFARADWAELSAEFAQLRLAQVQRRSAVNATFQDYPEAMRDVGGEVLQRWHDELQAAERPYWTELVARRTLAGVCVPAAPLVDQDATGPLVQALILTRAPDRRHARGALPRVGRFVAAVLAMLVPLVPPCCSRRPAVPAIARSPVDTLWYVSVRAREEGRDTRRLADSLEYGFVVSVVQSDDVLGGAVEITVADSVRLTREVFVEQLRARTGSAPTGDSLLILYVHGFGTSLHEAWEHAAQAQVRSRSPVPWVVFCWPARGSGVTWPSAGQIFSRSYRDDSAAAVESRPAFSRTLRDLLPAIGGHRMLLVAHSMGSQLVGESLAGDPDLQAALVRDPLRAIAFFAPDVEVWRFRDLVLPAARRMAGRVIVYASSDDRMLALSRASNGSERAGLIRGPVTAPAGVEMVDVTEGQAAESQLQRIFGSHHALRRASAALFDLVHVVPRRRDPTCRVTLGMATLVDQGVWRLTSRRPPPLSPAGACLR
ncbi:MAG: alpha/beta hydrolase [Gemmatimonadetes bacterium]|nr:alpha/beta hydrolase [Gemmatimonadota bacterium]